MIVAVVFGQEVHDGCSIESHHTGGSRCGMMGDGGGVWVVWVVWVVWWLEGQRD